MAHRNQCVTDDYIKGVKYGEHVAQKNMLEHIIKTTTTKKALSVVIWMIVCELIDKKTPEHKSREAILGMVNKQLDKWYK